LPAPKITAKTAPAAAEAPAAAPAATEEPSSVPWPQDDDLPPEERRLRLFDLDKRYGPCIGMTRSERWRRAQELGLNPPPDVHAILSSQPQAREACLWEGRV
jgi:DNA polymerase delta subunit 4